MGIVRSVSAALLCAVLSFGPSGCDRKKANSGKDAPMVATAKAPVVKPPPPPSTIDRAAAEKALTSFVWQGVSEGKALRLYVLPIPGGFAGALRYGAQNLVGRLTLDQRGKLKLLSRPRPSPLGLETHRFDAQLSQDFMRISGAGSREAKQGFVTQSFGLGNWVLSRGPALEGAPIFHVGKGSLTAALGILVGDELLELDGQKVKNGAIPKPKGQPGDEVTAVVLREGKRIDLKAEVPEGPPEGGKAPAKAQRADD